MDINEKFPNCKQADGYSRLKDCPSYDEIVEAFGHEIVVQVDDDDYQGDSRYLLKSGDRYGNLNIGWGSCSGCDAIQACCTIPEIQKLADDIEGSIQWFDSKEQAKQWFETHDWKGDYSWRNKKQSDFVEKVLVTLGSTAIVMRNDDGFRIEQGPQ